MVHLLVTVEMALLIAGLQKCQRQVPLPALLQLMYQGSAAEHVPSGGPKELDGAAPVATEQHGNHIALGDISQGCGGLPAGGLNALLSHGLQELRGLPVRCLPQGSQQGREAKCICGQRQGGHVMQPL